jgi:hypothetical protein
MQKDILNNLTLASNITVRIILFKALNLWNLNYREGSSLHEGDRIETAMKEYYPKPPTP